jgi:hypothetical protein
VGRQWHFGMKREAAAAAAAEPIVGGAAIIGNCASVVPQVCMQHTPWWTCLHLNLHFSCVRVETSCPLPLVITRGATSALMGGCLLIISPLLLPMLAGPSYLACLHSHFTTSTRGCIPDALRESRWPTALWQQPELPGALLAQIALQTAKVSRFSHYSTSLRGENFGCPDCAIRQVYYETCHKFNWL